MSDVETSMIAETKEVSTQTTPTRRADIVLQTPTHWDLTPTLKIKVKSQDDAIADLKKQLKDLKIVHSNFAQLSTSYKELSERNQHLETQIANLRSELEEKHNVFRQPIHRCRQEIVSSSNDDYHIPINNQFNGLADEHELISPSESSTSSEELFASNRPKLNVYPKESIECTTLIIRDSMLKHIKTNGVLETKVRTMRGATRNQVCCKINETELKVKDAIIHVGTNDCSLDNFTLEKFKDDYEALVTLLEHNVSGKVYISAMCQRLDDIKANEQVKMANEMLKSVFKHHFIDHTRYLNSGLHLNIKGTTTLLRSIHSVIPILKYSKDSKGQRSTATNVCCYYCNEPGHVSHVCRHRNPVTCWNCRKNGHKAKFCKETVCY